MNYFNAKEVEKETIRVLKDRPDPYVAYTIHEEDWVYSSNLNQTNKEYCKSNNVNISESYNMGGTIVASKGDLDVAIFKTNGWYIGKTMLEDVKKYLENKINNISIDGNDLLIDGKYKVMSFASINAGDKYIYTVIHVSINPNKDLIENVCTKEMKKIPKGLSEYGITTKEMVDLVTKLANEIN